MKNEKGEDMVYLNGELVEAKNIDPRKHKYIGQFREPSFPNLRCWNEKTKEWLRVEYKYIICSCGMSLFTTEVIMDHWNKGHFDIPQYVDIN